MKKSLQGFWRGGLLGSLLGLLGGEVFAVGTFLFFEISFLIQEGLSDPLIDWEILAFMQLFTALPGTLFGFFIGAVMGIPAIFFFSRLKTWKRIVGAGVSALLLHLLIVRIVYWNRLAFYTGHLDFYELYQTWKVEVVSIYLIAAILFGYYFPTFSPRWPKFLRRKVQETEEGIQ